MGNNALERKMRCCPKCSHEWIREEKSPKMECREIRLLDINNGTVDVDETITWHPEDVSNFFCNLCGFHFHVENLAELWEELDEI